MTIYSISKIFLRNVRNLVLYRFFQPIKIKLRLVKNLDPVLLFKRVVDKPGDL